MSPRVRFLRDLTVVLTVTAIVLLLATRFVVVPWAVRGVSMNPTLESGDRVLVDLWTCRSRPPRPGEIALLRGPDGSPVVKRVAEGPLPRDQVPGLSPFRPRTGNEEWFLVFGDNAGASEDSRTYGPVPRHRFLGVVRWRYWPPGRMGPIR